MATFKSFYNTDLDGYTFEICRGSCNGEEEQFEAWLAENYPGLSVDITLTGSEVLNDQGEDEFDGNSNMLWEEYCNS